MPGADLPPGQHSCSLSAPSAGPKIAPSVTAFMSQRNPFTLSDLMTRVGVGSKRSKILWKSSQSVAWMDAVLVKRASVQREMERSGRAEVCTGAGGELISRTVTVFSAQSTLCRQKMWFDVRSVTLSAGTWHQLDVAPREYSARTSAFAVDPDGGVVDGGVRRNGLPRGVPGASIHAGHRRSGEDSCREGQLRAWRVVPAMAYDHREPPRCEMCTMSEQRHPHIRERRVFERDAGYGAMRKLSDARNGSE